ARAAVVPESVEQLPTGKSRVAELAEEFEHDAARAGKAVAKTIDKSAEAAAEAIESVFGEEPARVPAQPVVVTPAPARAEIREERAAIREERSQIRQQERARIEAEEDRFGGYEPIPEGNERAETRIEIVRPEPKKLTVVERMEKRVGNAIGAAETGIRNEIRALEGKPPVASSMTTVERPIAEPVIVPRAAPVLSERTPAAIDVNAFDEEVPPRRTGIRQAGVAAESGLEAFESHAGGVYVVQPNDNYWKISRKVYGTGRYYNALAKHNQPRVPDPKQMRPGMKISTPPKEQLEHRYPELLRNSASASENHGPTGFYVNKAGHPMYRIGAEDTLSGIAQQCLGRSSRYTEIVELNRDRLRSADDLKIGLELRLPSDASQARIVNSPRERF
ncbi:MAG TPA: LysM peptidoglycan-binding domain-containing protein, partial [Planctomycetaceae bacterium]|nr:LysM peptidoglycan-binding domain-containing protein [Planctomycetaceae bacterium]